jgi:hypothetical protein
VGHYFRTAIIMFRRIRNITAATRAASCRLM